MYTQNVTTDKEREMRKKDLEEQDRYVSEKHTQKQKNQNFTQVYPLGWKRLRELFRGRCIGQNSCGWKGMRLCVKPS